MTLVCCRILPPVQPLMLSAKQGGMEYHFYSLWYDLAGARAPTSQSQGEHSHHKATELMMDTYCASFYQCQHQSQYQNWPQSIILYLRINRRYNFVEQCEMLMWNTVLIVCMTWKAWWVIVHAASTKKCTKQEPLIIHLMINPLWSFFKVVYHILLNTLGALFKQK